MNSAILESKYPLSPMQQGMLLHSLQEEGAYVQQVVCSLGESVNVELFFRAWQKVFDRHPILRSSIHWEGVDEPFQQVHSNLQCPFTTEDWGALTAESRQERFDSYLSVDRQLGFEFANAPLMRVALFRMADCDYRMVWTFHHALLDGRSDFLVLKEVFDLYDGAGKGQEPKLNQPRPFSDYINWLSEQDLSKEEAFWRQALRGFTSPTVMGDTDVLADLSLLKPAHACEQIRLSEKLSAELISHAKLSEVTLNNLLQASWALLIGRYTGEEDVVFGATRACRHWTLEGGESMVGLFINTLPLRVQLRPEERLLPWLRNLRSQQLVLREYEHTPLMKIQEWSEISRGRSLFDTVLVFEDYQTNNKLQAMGNGWSKRDFRRLEQTNYPLTLAVYAGSEIILKLEYDTQKFDRASVEQMLKHLETLLEAIARNPDCCIGELSMLTENERHKLVVEWNDTGKNTGLDHSIHRLFEEQVELAPESVAVMFEDRRLTYRDLNTRANQFAHYLQKRGVGPEVLVGICVERSLEMIVALLGILKTGAAYLPLDRAHPRKRLSHILADAEVPMLVTQAHLRETFADESVDVICIDTDWTEISQESGKNPEGIRDGGNLAYVIYTSGSTGKPKGTLVEHSSLTNYLVWFNENIGNQARLLPAVTSLSFDASLKQVFAPLLRGETVWLLPERILAEPFELVKAVASQSSVGINAVPSVWRVILEEIESSEHNEIKGLKYLLLGGERLSRDLIDRSFAAFPDIKIWNLYGPTEATCNACCERIFPGDRVTIGRPIANTQIYILDRNVRLVPVGVPGELHIGGAGVARGYINRPGETAERFIRNPFSDNPSDRLYKTGDLARFLPSGEIQYLDRIDNQVKIRGYRIELGEIEAALLAHPNVKDSVVIAREDKDGNQRLVGYVVPKGDVALDVTELRIFLQEQFPEYMVPSTFITLEMLPLTSNGKVDRQALREHEPTRSDSGSAFVQPRDTLEFQLAKIWENVLDVASIGVTDNFFDLGGHSLLAAKLFGRIEKVIGRRLPLAALFQAPTIEQLAVVLRRQGWQPSWSRLVALNPGGSKLPLYCVHAGRGDVLFYRDLAIHLGPDQPFYALQSLGLNGEPPVMARVEEIAAQYIQEIRTLQPEGPYLLGGACFGAYLAFEMAQQLHRVGQRVDLLVIFDTSPPRAVQAPASNGSEKTLGHYAVRSLYHLKERQLRGIALRWISERRTIRELSDSFGRFSEKVFGGSEIRRRLRLAKEYRKVGNKYLADSYPGRITLIRSSEFSSLKRKNGQLLWGDLAVEGLDSFVVHGTHADLLKEPSVRSLADQLRSRLDAVQANT